MNIAVFIALTYQKGDDMTLTSIPDLTVTNNRKGHRRANIDPKSHPTRFLFLELRDR